MIATLLIGIYLIGYGYGLYRSKQAFKENVRTMPMKTYFLMAIMWPIYLAYLTLIQAKGNLR